MKELTAMEKRARFKRTVRVRNALRESGYEAVITHFRESRDLNLVAGLIFELRRIESLIIEDMMDADEVDVDEDIGSCVFAHLSEWSERLGSMARMLVETRDRAWEVLEKIEGFASENR
jgi:hypothetical protein